MSHRRSAALALLVAAALLLAACGIDAEAVGSGTKIESTADTTPAITVPPVTTPTTAPEPLAADDFDAIVADVEDFWTTEMPSVYDDEYEPLDPARIVPATPDVELPPCMGDDISYDDVEDNAFAAPCREGLTVMWDAEGLFPQIEADYGPVAAAIVLAHEWGHIVQFQADVDGPTIVLEQQADCFAGAWLADFLDSPGSLGSLAAASPLDSSVSSIVTFRDEPGTPTDFFGAHGTGFDRVRALQEGFDRGAEFCVEYESKTPPLIDLELSLDGQPVGVGDLPLPDLVPLVVNDLNRFYNSVISGFRGASIDGVLGDENAIATLQGLSDRIGDNAAGVVLGMIWAGFAQGQVEGGEERDAEGRLLQQACLAGGWFADVIDDTGNQDRNLQLSNGDMDEAILGLIDLAGDQELDDGGVFRLIASLRQGVVDGFDSCGLGR